MFLKAAVCDIWYLLHVESQVSGQNSLLNHLQCGLVLVQRETAQNLITLRENNLLSVLLWQDV